MRVTNFTITYINALNLLLFLFIIGSFFWVAVPDANAGAFPCSSGSCQTQADCENLANCSVGGGASGIPCFWSGTECLDSPPQIPTLNQWGMIIVGGVLGLFAVIGIFAMRRRTEAAN